MKLAEFLRNKKIAEGDIVSVKAKDGKTLEGTIIPSKDGQILVLKLKSGYNAGVKVSEVKSVEKVGAGKKVGKAPVKETPHKEGLPLIALINVGGTIASRVDYRTGAVRWNLKPVELISMYPELSKIANFKGISLRTMATDDFRFKHFGLIARAVEKEWKKGAQGVILTMGTDNMHYASAALAFILEKCPIPVIITGAQRSSDRGSTDAGMNLECAAKFIAKTDFAGVCICMHDSISDDYCAILPACKTRKMHSSRRDAFKPINDTAIAKVKWRGDEIKFVKENYARKSKEKMKVKAKMEEKVGLLKITVHMFPEQFLLFKNFKGLVIEGTGLGHTPLEVIDEFTKIHKKIESALKLLDKKGIVMVMTSTCLNGRVGMHVYSKGTDLMSLGVFPGEDLLPETALIKLSWLLGQCAGKNRKEKVKELLRKNLRGEITECTDIKAFQKEFEKEK